MKRIILQLALIMMYQLSIGQPTNNAADPTNKPSDVISIYGGAFTNIATNYNPYWGQSGAAQVNPNFDPGTGNLVLAYPNFNYQGTELTTQNASGMEFLHIDIWTNDATNVKVSPINNGTGAGEFLVEVPLIKGAWSSVDLPKSAFTGMTWDSVFQLKFDGQGGVSPSTIYLDNIYFWKAPLATGSDATLSDLKVDGNTIMGFSSSAADYTYSLVVGSTVVPQITSATTTDAGASITSIVQATGIPGEGKVNVTSQNGKVTQTYTVKFLADIPNPSPTPSTPDNEVLNIYSDTGNFTNKWVRDYNFGSINSIVDLDTSEKVNEAIKMNLAVSGYGEGKGTVTDLSAYNYVHFDYFADTGAYEFKLFLMKSDNGVVTEYTYELKATGSDGDLITGSWQSIDIPLSFFEGKGFNKTQFFQFKFDALDNLQSKIIYFDNIYFSKNKGTILSNTQFETVGYTTYPNPTNSTWTIESKKSILAIQLFDISGKKIQEDRPNLNVFQIDASQLSKGMYFGKITTEDGFSVIKLNKN